MNDSFDGTWRNEEEKTCFSFGKVPEYCQRIELYRSAFTFVEADGKRFSGPVFEVGPSPPRLASSARPVDDGFCAAINAIDNASADKFTSLIDQGVSLDQGNDVSDVSYRSTISIGAKACTIGVGSFGQDKGILGPKHECLLQYKRGESAADEAYQIAIQQNPLCLTSNLNSADIDLHLRSASSSDTTESVERETIFETHGGTNFRVSLERRLTCSDSLTCHWTSGVWIGATLKN